MNIRMLFVFLLLSASVTAQIRQLNDYVYIFPNGSTVTSYSQNGKQFVSVLTSDTLLRLYDNGVTVWKANLQAANISDTLSASGITGLCRVTVPNSFGTNQIIQIRDIAIICSNSYRLDYQLHWQLPINVVRISDGVTICTVYENGFIDWGVTPQWSWTGRVGSTRIKRITLP